MPNRAVRLSFLLATLPAAGAAQLIGIKTVPFATGDQFEIFPSQNAGMGGVSLALPDTLLDPFRNPATGARLLRARFFAAPTVYGVSRQSGGGRTLPLGAFLPMRSWYAGIGFALQEMVPARPPAFFPPPCAQCLRAPAFLTTAQTGFGDQPHGNAFAFATLGKTLPRTGLSLAASALWAGLSAVDGVDQLYSGSDRVRQTGQRLDTRLGLLKEWAGGASLEALVLYDRLAMTHDVTYLDLVWDPGTQQAILQARVERNRDLARTWGAHFAYARPLAATGWRIGWVATANRVSQPHIPSTNVMSIPSDPGRSTAYNLGMGVSRTSGAARFGLDLILEPIWSTTGTTADVPVATLLGDTIPVGGTTLENRFRFTNVLFRIGVGRDVTLGPLGRAAGLQLGLGVRAVRYTLAQADFIQATRSGYDEGWLEWTPAWGLSLRFPELEIRYRGRLTSGAGRPRTEVPPIFFTGDILPPIGFDDTAAPLMLRDVRVLTHQVSVSLPLR